MLPEHLSRQPAGELATFSRQTSIMCCLFWAPPFPSSGST